MSQNPIIISDGSGSTISTPISSMYYDDVNNYIYINNLTSSYFFVSGANNAIFLSINGNISKINATSTSGSFLISDGTKFVVSKLPYSIVTGSVSGDLTGSYPNPTLKNVGNVISGSLKVANGGLSGSNIQNIVSGSFITASSTSTLAAVSTSSYNGVGNWILISDGTKWTSAQIPDTQRNVNLQYFTSSRYAGSTYTWTKQNSNHTWARVMLQGGGNSAYGAGGFTDAEVYIGDTSTATITIGGPNQQTTFSSSNIYLSAREGGYYGNPSSWGPSAGGAGLTFYGGNWPGGVSAGASNNYGTAGAYTVDNNTPGTYVPDLFGYTLPIGFGAGYIFGGGDAGGSSGFAIVLSY